MLSLTFVGAGAAGGALVRDSRSADRFVRINSVACSSEGVRAKASMQCSRVNPMSISYYEIVRLGNHKVFSSYNEV